MDQLKRYQIFVSSTFTDLKTERGKVMETILSYDCFPAGMEMFPAMDEEQFEYIKRIIDDSDYYLLIIGGRYGSMDKDGKSWTEKEYDYAVSKGIPVIIFDHEDFTKLPANKTDQNDKKRRKLVKFKKKAAERKLIKYWTNADDLALAVSTSLRSVLQLQPRIGWVRANLVISDDEQIEIERLKKMVDDRLAEINKLQTGIDDFKADLNKKDEDLKSKEAELKKKDTENKTLEMEYQAALQEIDSLKEKIKTLETEQDRIKLSVKPQQETETFNVKGVSFKMVYVRGGSFKMGASEGDKDAYPNEKPAHEVTLSDYWIGETQVTQALWLAVMGVNPSAFGGDLNCPVENVSWYDCQNFIEKLNKLTGKEFHLPTEAQWEFAARGGNRDKDNHYQFAGSNNVDKVAWFVRNSHYKTHPVGEKQPNILGLYDMSGNECEWCNDWYGSTYYSKSPTVVDPAGPATGCSRVHRGGSWKSDAMYCRVSDRGYSTPSQPDRHLGLRLAL